MRVHVQSLFDAPADVVWQKVQTLALLNEVIYPLLRFAPADGETFPEHWSQGDRARGKLYLFGFLPLGSHTIGIDSVNDEQRTLETREQGSLARSWNHAVTVDAADADRTLYADSIEIDAGLLTPLVWLFAQAFYRHRHLRWKRLLRRSQPRGNVAVS